MTKRTKTMVVCDGGISHQPSGLRRFTRAWKTRCRALARQRDDLAACPCTPYSVYIGVNHEANRKPVLSLAKYLLATALVWLLPVGVTGAENPLKTASAGKGSGDAMSVQESFVNPPMDVAPGVMWHWVSGIAGTPADVTEDLESFRKQGIGRVTLFEQSDHKVPGNAKWMELFGFAAAEAKRLGMQFETADAWHYVPSHGPWIKPENLQKVLTWSRVFVKGGGRCSEQLPRPPAAVNKPGYNEFYRDIATFAVKVADPQSVAATMEGAQPVWRSDLPDQAVPLSGKAVEMDLAGGPRQFVCEFAKPYAAAGLFLVYGEQNSGICEVEVSQDGVTYTPLKTIELSQSNPFLNKCWQHGVWLFNEVQAQFFRMKLSAVPKGVMPFRLARMEWLQKGEWPRLIPPIARPALKNGDTHMWEHLERNSMEGAELYFSQHEHLPPGRAVAEMVDLTGMMKEDGTLEWDAPEGSWIVYRLGYCAKKVVFDSCDKLDAAGIELHFPNYPGALIRKAKESGGALPDIYIDSWEVGGQNWSANFAEEFKKRRGYDLKGYLPALVGEIVTNTEVSNRFLRDFRRTIADLFADNYYGRLRELCNELGVGLTTQAGPAVNFSHYTDLMMDVLMQYGRSDTFMGEFWNGPDPAANNPAPTPYENGCLRSAVSAAHQYGRKVVQAESFTGGPAFRAAPSSLKPSGDRAFCMGVNQLIIHESTSQVAGNPAKPGRSWIWGTDWQRNITWWDYSHFWLDYLRRCQYLLQQGQPVVDVCVFMGEQIPCFPGIELMRNYKSTIPPAYKLPAGFKQDWCNVEGLMTMRVENGEMVLPGGMRCRLLLLPEHRASSPSVLKKLQELIEAGATVLGPKPLRSPSLEGYPGCDREVQSLADHLWGAIDGKALRENRVGQGRLLWGHSLEEALALSGLKPDFSGAPVSGPNLELGYYHRRLADQDIYFVANHADAPFVGDGFFRVEGRRPELWDPGSGTRRLPALYKQEPGLTRVRLSLPPRASTFVVFQLPSATDMRIEKIRTAGALVDPMSPNAGNIDAVFEPEVGGQLTVTGLKHGTYEVTLANGAAAPLEVPSAPEREIAGPWEVTFPANSGAPPKVNFETLVPWTEHAEDGIKFFSGTAEYRKVFEVADDSLTSGARRILDLGRVEHLAEILLNGKSLGVAWTAPYAVDVTGALRKGNNELVIKVTNVWFNRLLGDARVPAEQRIAQFSDPKFFEQSFLGKVKNQPLVPSGLLGPVRIQTIPVAAFPSETGGKPVTKGIR